VVLIGFGRFSLSLLFSCILTLDKVGGFLCLDGSCHFCGVSDGSKSDKKGVLCNKMEHG